MEPGESAVAVIGIGLGLLALSHYYRNTSPLRSRQYFSRWPLIGRFLRLYHTYYFAYEFSQLFMLGYSAQQMMREFQAQDHVPFLSDFGAFLAQQYEDGIPFSDSLRMAAIFTPEFPAIVQQGEQLNALAVKLRLYANRCYDQLTHDVQVTIHGLQNGLFVLVALIVVLVYLLLMLPMFSIIGGLES